MTAILKDKELTKIMSHLFLSVLVIVSYLITAILGTPDAMLQNGAILVLGFWFGAMGSGKVKDTIQKKKNTNEEEGGPNE